MKTIRNREDLEDNLKTIERYLAEGTAEEQTFAESLIRLGKCLFAYKSENEVRFAPSRFIGYRGNTKKLHARNMTKHGSETNSIIKSILGKPPVVNVSLEEQYFSYCQSLNIPITATHRKFWFIELEQDFKENLETEKEFSEGKVAERRHKFRERNSEVVRLAKQLFKEKHGRLYCQVCKFDFEETYGADGADFIECHHTIPVSSMEPGHVTKVEDLAMVCANCHRMLHRRRPWLSMKRIQELVQN